MLRIFVAIETRIMFGVAAVGVSAVFGYGLYKYVSGKQNARKIKEAIDKMVSFHDYASLLAHFSPRANAVRCARKNYHELIICA